MVFTMSKIEWQGVTKSCCDECPVISMETCDQCPIKMYGDLLAVRGLYGIGSTEEENVSKLFNSTMSSKENMGRQL